MILAPMQGLTEVLFRRVYEECFPGAFSYAVSPFLSLTHGNLAEAWKKIDDVLPDANVRSMPVVPQILGKETQEFVELGNRLYDLGYTEINWNMGCPMRKVTGKQRGSGILPHPEMVDGILDAVIPKLRPNLSIKMRLGLRNKDEIFALIPILNRYPLASVTVHPRLGRQQYNGHPDLETFGDVLPMIDHPVIYNGDICTAADAHRILERFTKVADLMIGRGVLYRPTLPLEIAGTGNVDSEKIKHFVARLMEEIDRQLPTEQSRIRKTKEYWCLIWKSLSISEMQAREVLHEQDYISVRKKIFIFLQ